MADSWTDTERVCPTRDSGHAPLIVQRIALATCFERQRRNYHKCFTCAYRGLAANERPALAAPREVEAPPEPEPARKRRAR